MDWIGQHYYGSLPTEFHRGRMTQQDYQFMKSFMLAQDSITDFQPLDPSLHEITDNLDRFRPAFVGHPTNYLDLYAQTHGLYTSPERQQAVATLPWLSVPNPQPQPGRPIVLNRTQRWATPTLVDQWRTWAEEEHWQDRALFVGLPREHDLFCRDLGLDIAYCPTPTLLDLAQVIAGAQTFVGNQSQGLALAIGLGVADIRCEIRRDLPKERNECYFPQRSNVQYF
jgi:hypothetical protein